MIAVCFVPAAPTAMPQAPPLTGSSLSISVTFLVLGLLVLLLGLRKVSDSEVAVIYRNKRFVRLAGPGLIWVLPLFEEIRLQIPTQCRNQTLQILDLATADGGRVNVRVTVSYYLDPYQVERDHREQMHEWLWQDWQKLIENKLYAVLSHIVGRYAQLKWEREHLFGSEDIRKEIESQLATAVRPWGIRLASPEGLWIGHVEFAKTEKGTRHVPPGPTVPTGQWPPLTFRRGLMQQLMPRIKGGASCCLVGANGMGKTTLLHFLSQPHVRTHYLGEEAQRFVFPLLSCGMLGEKQERSVFELALDCLCEERSLASVISPEAHGYVRQLHNRCTTSENRPGAFRALDLAVRYLCGQWNLHIVFLIDEFDELRAVLKQEGLLALWGLYDACKDHVSYVLAMRDAHWAAMTGLEECEDFCELFTQNVLGLPPYNREDVRILVMRKSSEQNLKVQESDIALLVGVTGGHPGLLVAALPLVLRDEINVRANVIAQLLQRTEIRAACQRIFYGLPDEEQRVLAGVARSLPLEPTLKGALDALRLMMLVQERDGRLIIPYPLLEAYLKGTV